MGSPNDYQVGGNHYKTSHEHWDWVDANGIGYLEGCATKYLSRWRKKQGLDDLKKARHYTVKLIERATHHGRTNGCDGTREFTFDDFALSNNLEPLERLGCHILAYWSTVDQLHHAVKVINAIIQTNFPEEFQKETT